MVFSVGMHSKAASPRPLHQAKSSYVIPLTGIPHRMNLGKQLGLVRGDYSWLIKNCP